MSAESEKELQQLKKRFIDLADKSSRQGIYTFTSFLGLSEQDAFWQIEKEIKYAGYCLYGGMDGTDRKIIRFGNAKEFGYEVEYPIKCIHIKPLLPKFADKLSHRDFLGSIMNLGIDRGTIGDIKVGDKEAYIFCLDKVAEYICDNLKKIKHTNVECKITEKTDAFPEAEPERVNIQVASNRLDAVIAKVYNKSRGDCLELFRGGRVFVNGKLCENNSRILKEQETVNVRGFGKFVMAGEPGETRKGKLSMTVDVFR